MGEIAKIAIRSAAMACVCIAAAGLGRAAFADDAGKTTDAAAEGTQVAQNGIEVPTKETYVQRGRTVFERSRPEVRAMGVRAGTFIVLPHVAVNQEYNDNIFATADNEKDDFITHVEPGAYVTSDWNNHEVHFDASGDVARYWDNSDEDYENYRVGIGGRLDVLRSTSINADARYQWLHEERSSPDDVSGVEPTPFTVASANIEGRHKINRVSLRAGGRIDSYNFDDVQNALGATINNDDRDRNDLTGYARVGYELVQEYEAFIRGSYNTRNYDSAVDDSGFMRDSKGYEVVAGVSLDFGGLTFGDFFAGYRTQDYDDARLKTVSGPTVGADITWNATPLTTLIGTVSRDVRETLTTDANGNTASARFFTTLGISAQHELLRNLLLGLDASYSQDDFEGIDRTDDIYRIGLNATYMMNRVVHLSGGYRYLVRDSESASSDFTINSLFVQVRLQY